MAGFLGERKAEGVHDDLYAKALFLEFAEHQKFLLIALDTLAISLDFSQAVSSEVERRIGISRDHIFIAATHTHSGPEGLQSTKLITPDGKVLHVGNIDTALFNFTVEQTVNSALESMKMLNQESYCLENAPLLKGCLVIAESLTQRNYYPLSRC